MLNYITQKNETKAFEHKNSLTIFSSKNNTKNTKPKHGISLRHFVEQFEGKPLFLSQPFPQTLPPELIPKLEHQQPSDTLESSSHRLIDSIRSRHQAMENSDRSIKL
ncbi:hypothetical protein Droror1_Dr00008168 [Drosera rotundifolia]